MAFLYGVLGTLSVMLLLAIGFYAGWAAHRHASKLLQRKADPLTTSEEVRLREEQEAFERLQNYTVEDAYGINERLRGGNAS